MRKFLLMLALCLLLAGCDLGNTTTDATSTSASSTTPSATDTPSGTADTPTDTPQPSATNTPNPSGVPSAKACGSTFPSNRIYGYFGDMLISQPFYGSLSYLGMRLPDTMPGGKPFQETTPTSTLGFTGGVTQNPAPVVLAALPDSSATSFLGDRLGGFVFTICNSSTTKSHVLNALGVQIASFIPATATSLNIEVGCDHAISSKNTSGGGCGGSAGSLDGFHASWPTGAGVGSTITLNQTGNSSSYGPLPITLKPGQLYNVSVGSNFPGRSGTYTFTFGMQVDNGSLATVSAPSFPLFMGTGLHLWSGKACLANATWKQQVMASTSYFVCPA